jgi:site-specific DNA-adenine methylase
MPKTDQQYEYNFTLEDHEMFVEQAKKCKHKLCISYDNCDLVREWFAGSHFTIHNEEWTYSGSSKSEKDIGKEVIITNY